jgi:hypothetical protein
MRPSSSYVFGDSPGPNAGSRACIYGAAVIAMTVIGGCATVNKVQAPFDSYVCVRSSLEQCANYVMRNWPNESTHFADPSQFTIVDADAGKTVSTGDGKFQCAYGAAAYKQRLNVKQEVAAVFFSPIVLANAKDGLVRLNRARTGCARVAQSYDFQNDLLAAQDSQAKDQLLVQYLSARVEADSLANGNVGGENPTSADITAFGLPTDSTNSIRGWLQTYRNASTVVAEQLRNKLRQQSVSADFPRQFIDAQNLIDSALRDFEKQLFILDFSTLVDSNVRFEISPYRRGAWIRQGSDALREVTN